MGPLVYAGRNVSADVIIEQIRESDLTVLDGKVYFDYARMNLIADSQLRDSESYRTLKLVADPESSNETRRAIDRVREYILSDVLHASAGVYTLVFTGSVAASWKLIGESFPWTGESTYRYDESASQNVIGVRQMAAKNVALDSSAFARLSSVGDADDVWTELTSAPKDLVVLSLVNGFDGSRVPRSVLRAVMKSANAGLFENDGPSFVAADATVAGGTTFIDLSDTPFHAVVLSLQEMFGVPDISAIAFRNDALSYNEKRFYGGGTTVYSLIGKDYEVPRTGHALWEDGSIKYDGIIATHANIDLLTALPIQQTEIRAFKLAQLMYEKLTAIDVGGHVTFFGNHGSSDSSTQAPIVSFAVKGRTSISIVNAAYEHGFVTSYVCMESLKRCLDAAVISETAFVRDLDPTVALGNQMIKGEALGAVRVSLGWASVESDVDHFVDWFKTILESL